MAAMLELTSEIDNARLARIEDKVDKLADIVSNLAVIDERLSNFIRENSRTASRVSDVEEKLSTLNALLSVLSIKVQILERICWGLGAGVMTSFGTILAKATGLI